MSPSLRDLSPRKLKKPSTCLHVFGGLLEPGYSWVPQIIPNNLVHVSIETHGDLRIFHVEKPVIIFPKYCFELLVKDTYPMFYLWFKCVKSILGCRRAHGHPQSLVYQVCKFPVQWEKMWKPTIRGAFGLWISSANMGVFSRSVRSQCHDSKRPQSDAHERPL